jgi:hypothetical protein
MARSESQPGQNGGIVETAKTINKVTRNTALGVAGGAALLGVEALVVGGLLWAAGDQVQISLIDRFQAWRKRRKEAKMENRGAKPITVFERVHRTLFAPSKARTA